MTCDFYQTPLVKYSWIFQNVKDNDNALAPSFWQTYVQCYELSKVMQKFDMVLIQTLNKFWTTTKNTKDIEFINSNCNKEPPNNYTIMYLFYTNKLVQKHNENVFTNMFIFKAMNTNHQSCPPFYKFSNDRNKTTNFHFTINI
jgi:hypothetical protein